MARLDAKGAALWVVGLLLGLFYLMSAWPKLQGAEPMVERFSAWGYSAGFLRFIGALEALGGLLLLVPKLAAWGALILIVVMAGAVYTHLTSGIGSPLIAIVCLVVLAVVAWLRRRQALGLAS